MQTIVHLSDLHPSRVDPNILAPLLRRHAWRSEAPAFDLLSADRFQHVDHCLLPRYRTRAALDVKSVFVSPDARQKPRSACYPRIPSLPGRAAAPRPGSLWPLAPRKGARRPGFCVVCPPFSRKGSCEPSERNFARSSPGSW